MRLASWILGSIELFRLAVVTRFRFGGRYWAWRRETAFGRGMPGRWALIAAAVRHGAWARRMRRGE